MSPRLRRLIVKSRIGLGVIAMMALGHPAEVDAKQFQGADGAQWQVHSPTGELRWDSKRGLSGFAYSAARGPEEPKEGMGQDFAVAAWPVGTGPFEIEWKVTIAAGEYERWRYGGIYLALASAPPTQMQANDIAVLMGSLYAGALATVRQGETDLGIFAQDLSQLAIIQGGDIESVTWPDAVIQPDTILTFKMQRDGKSQIRFEVYHSGLDATGKKPWWTGTWQMPPEVASVPLKYVVVRRVPGHHTEQRGLLAGVVGRTNDSDSLKTATMVPPSARWLEKIEPRDVAPQGGEVVTLHGAGFDATTHVFMNRKEVEVVERVNSRQMKIRVPAGAVGLAEVTATNGELIFSGSPAFGFSQHPYLWFDDERLAGLRARFSDPGFSDYRKILLDAADEVLAGSVKYDGPDRCSMVDALLWAYLLGGDTRYRDALLVEVDRVCGELKHAEFYQMMAVSMAGVYDALFAELGVERRVRMLRYLDRAQYAYQYARGRGKWWYGDASNPSNTVPVGAAGGGIVALALVHSTPGARDMVTLAADTVQTYYHGLADDGGCVEGTLYWSYGLTYYLMLGHAMENVLGDSRGFLYTPTLRKNGRFLETQLGGDGRLFSFGDTQPWLTGLPICADLGKRFDVPLMRWMESQMVKRLAAGDASVDARPLHRVLGFLWGSDSSKNLAFPGVPVVSALEEMNWAVLRSDGSAGPGLVAGIKGHGGRFSHHVQNDLGSFVVQSGGEAMLIDPGYFQPDATSHSVPLIDSQGPDDGRKAQAPVTVIGSQGNLRWCQVDLSGAYPDVVRITRTFVMVGADALVVLDDIEAGGKTVTAQWQTGFPAQVSGVNAVIQGKHQRLHLQTFGPSLKVKSEGPRDFGQSWIFKKEGVQWHRLSADYTARPDTPLVSVLSPSASPVQVERTGDCMTIKLPTGEQISFTRTATGWQFAPH